MMHLLDEAQIDHVLAITFQSGCGESLRLSEPEPLEATAKQARKRTCMRVALTKRRPSTTCSKNPGRKIVVIDTEIDELGSRSQLQAVVDTLDLAFYRVGRALERACDLGNSCAQFQ